MDKDAAPFKTSDLGLAAYLSLKGLELLGCTPSGEQGRLFFVFIDAEDRDDWLESWNTGMDQVSAKAYFMRLRRCKKLLQEPISL